MATPDSQIPNSAFRNPTWLLLGIGIALRIAFQFLFPSFSGDEINLGNNIKHRGFLELLAPLDSFQSAPPMFLWLQKLVIAVSPFDFWISIKLVSFIVSVAILFQTAKLSRSLFGHLPAQMLFVSFFVFSPSVLYHTLTVKQYGCDLLFLLFALNNFPRLKNTYLGPLVFTVWCLFSNIGLFFVAAMGIYKLISFIRCEGLPTLHRFFFDSRNILLALSPLPYVLYFLWYVRQPGAEEIKAYMRGYWETTFVPLDGGIFEYAARLFDDVVFYFVSPNTALAYLIVIIAIIGIFPMFTRQSDEKREIVAFLLLGGLVHAVLSAMQMFPVSERLYLYESPLMYIFIASGVTLMCGRYAGLVLGVMAVALTGYNVISIPFKQNDIVSMLRYMNREKISDVAFSGRAYDDVRSFNDFTDAAFAPGYGIRELGDAENAGSGFHAEVGDTGHGARDAEGRNPNSEIQNSRYIIGRSHIEFRHQPTMVEEEDEILWLQRSGRLRLVHQTQGYKLFEWIR